MELIYCLKCKTKTETKNLHNETSKNNRLMLKGVCTVCGTKKSMFISNKKGKGLVDKLPFELHLPLHQFTGPGTDLKKRLNSDGTPKEKYKPYNQVDAISLEHDKCYEKYPTRKERSDICDVEMLKELDVLKENKIHPWGRRITKNIIGAKRTLRL